MNKAKTEIENFKTEVAGLKIRIRRIENFLFSFPEAKDYLHEAEELGDQELFEQAKVLVSKYDRVSASLLQRRLMTGYVKAAHLLDKLEEAGVVGSADGSKPREVLIKKPKKKVK